MRLVIRVLMLATLVTAIAAPVFAEPISASGVIVAVSTDDNTLLVDTPQGFQLLAVDPAADIQAGATTGMRLGEIRPGDRVQYSADRWAGMVIATSLRLAKERQAAKHQ